MIRKYLLLCAFAIFAFKANSQQVDPYLSKGDLSLGLRTTTSFFGHDNVPGLGTGGQFRLQLFDFMSTEWFADWITMDLNGAGVRNNAHIGWSVLFYPKKVNRFVPYLIAGHCFDYAEVTPLSTAFVDRSDERLTRWSSAVQAGAGMHYFLSNRFNFTFSGQYMLHFGEHLNYELVQAGQGYFLDTNPTDSHEESLEGHLLLTVSLNYKIADLW